MRNGAPGEANSKKKSFPCSLQGDEGRNTLFPKAVRNLSKGKKEILYYDCLTLRILAGWVISSDRGIEEPVNISKMDLK